MRNKTNIDNYNITYSICDGDLLFGHTGYDSLKRIYISYIRNNYNKLYYEK